MIHVLVVEDSPTQAAYLGVSLEEQGFAVTTARSGEEAIDRCDKAGFDVVLSDVVMPGMSGYEFCRRLKSSSHTSQIPVILLTSLSEPMDIIRGLECGADNFLTKPYKVDDLVGRINRIVASKRVRGGSRVALGVDIMFLGNKFTITSDKEQILDLLISTFEDTVRANQELQRSKAELAAAQSELQGYAAQLEDRVQERTAELARMNEDLQNEISVRKQTEEQLVHAQKMEAIGTLTGGMAHDFNNLLAVIIGNLDLLRGRERADPEVNELAGEALDAATRGADLTRRLLAFARRQPLRPEYTDVNEMVRGITKLLERTLGRQIEIVLDLDTEVWPVVADPAQLESSLTNLATNARDAMPKGGRLLIATCNRRLDADYAAQHQEVVEGDYAMISVSDTGSGMTPEVMRHIFEPFYTTKERGRGTGLGLSMVFGFMKQSGGHINVYSEVGVGTTFRLYLPRAPQDAKARMALPILETLCGKGETILAVEDNPALRRVLVRQLRELNFRVIEAEDATMALGTLERESIDLLLTDVIMPGATTGIDIARITMARWPEVRIVLTSGFPHTNFYEDLKSCGNVRLLSKPYRKEELARTLCEALS